MATYNGTPFNDDFTGSNRGTYYTDVYNTYGGDDKVDSSSGDDSISVGAGFDTVYAGDGGDNIYGGDNDDIIYGDLGNDWINGDGGNDTIYGGLENDQLYGGANDDVFMHEGNEGWDFYNGDDGTDTIRVLNLNSSVLWGEIKISSLSGIEKIENLDLTGKGVDILASGLLDLSAVEVDGIRSVIGGVGNDSITGASNPLSSSLNDKIDGKGGDDTLDGRDGNDLLKGDIGNDRLYGGSGSDTMEGGVGDDVYVVDAAGDVITEAANAGTDRVESGVTITLAANVENLVLTGTSVIHGTGNVLANSLTGNVGGNSLAGGDEADMLFGDAGNDVLLGGVGDDTLSSGTGNDTLTGGTGADPFVFTGTGTGTDRITDFNQLDGGAAAEQQVLGRVDHTHSTGADGPQQPVTTYRLTASGEPHAWRGG